MYIMFTVFFVNFVFSCIASLGQLNGEGGVGKGRCILWYTVVLFFFVTSCVFCHW